MEIDKLLAYCGLTCSSCPIYLATRETDKEKQARMRIEIAKFINEHYGMAIKPEDINDCDGCRILSDKLYSGCNQCEIRKCAQDRGCLTCAHCSEYPCDKLQTLFNSEPSAKVRLDELRKSL